MSDIQLGEPYVLTASGGFGSGVGSIPQGSVVLPTEIVPPGTPGVGYSTGDVVLVAYTDTITFPGTPVERTLAIDVSTFEGAYTLQADMPPVEQPPPPDGDPNSPDPQEPGDV
ncbi:hypothetical protein [Streptomyces sp. NPDC004528]|uniref:hypothetical protein n=1 Tax=Streptomyces sp. NPDC004528 TaxID=3154550 RepID=UPI0033BCEDA3